MPVIVAVISQKGGVGKSTLARALAVAAAGDGLAVRLADLDTQQRTLVFWGETRVANGVSPAIAVEAFAHAGEAVASARTGEVMILDTGGQVNDATLALVQRAHLVEFGYGVLPGAIPERAAYRTALDSGRSPAECDDASASMPMEILVQAVLAKVHALCALGSRPAGTRSRQVRKRA